MSSNYTEEGYWLPSLSDKLVITVIFASILITGVIGNVLILTLILLVKKMRNAVNLCLASLALADLIVLVFLPTIPLVWLFELDASFMGAYYCVFTAAIDRGAIVCTVLIFLLIAVERYKVICHPIKSLKMWTVRKICGLLILIWLITIGVSVPFGYATRYDNLEFENVTQTYCYITWTEPWVKGYDIAVTITSFFLTIPVLTVLYVKMIITLKTEVPQSDAQGVGTRMARKARLQVVVMLVTVLVIFVVSLLPLRVYVIILHMNRGTLQALGDQSVFAINWFCRLMMYVNHTANPIVYFLMSRNFRDAFRQLFCSYWTGVRFDRQSSAGRATET